MTTPSEPVAVELNPEHDPELGNPELSVASTLVPWPRDDEKARYFGYRSTGFSVREALRMIERSKAWLSGCRHDSIFVDLERRIPEIRKELSREYLELDFYRNFRLALEKDYRVLNRSLGFERFDDGTVVPMTSYDQEYLLKMRSQYSPQQLSILEAIVSDSGKGFDFAQYVADNPEIIQMSRTDTITVKKGVSHALEA